MDVVKIDRSFVMDIDKSLRHRSIIQAIANIASALGASILAEGVETEDEASTLHALGCNAAQGYYFGRPAPLDELIVMLERDVDPTCDFWASRQGDAAMT
jgi:EAL domain-containing protein (putative c-di-GMP-specific phosphodiesterase class I)